MLPLCTYIEIVYRKINGYTINTAYVYINVCVCARTFTFKDSKVWGQTPDLSGVPVAWTILGGVFTTLLGAGGILGV